MGTSTGAANVWSCITYHANSLRKIRKNICNLSPCKTYNRKSSINRRACKSKSLRVKHLVKRVRPGPKKGYWNRKHAYKLFYKLVYRRVCYNRAHKNYAENAR